MKYILIMDSGKEYIFEAYDDEDLLANLYTENKLPMGGSVSLLTNGFVSIDDKTIINPSHISSIERLSEE